MRSAEGDFGSPGIVIIFPVSTTINSAPAETLTFLTVTLNPVGAPSSAASSEKLYCVFAIQTGNFENPSFSSVSISFFALGVKSTTSQP